MTYEKYKLDCQSLGFTPTMTMKQFYEMQNETDEVDKVRVNYSRPIEATHFNHLKLETDEAS